MINVNDQKERTRRFKTILETLECNVLPMTASDIVGKTGLSRNIIYHLLRSVEVRGLILINQISLKKVTYQLSAKGHCSNFREIDFNNLSQYTPSLKFEQSMLEFFYIVTTPKCGEIYC